MTKKNNKTFLQTLMSLFKSQTKKQSSATAKVSKAKKTKRTKVPMKGGMIRDGTVVQNMPNRS
jgi:hypothetical protein